MSFSVTILGSNSAVPSHDRFPSAQILKHYNSQYLIDCGEGTQFQMNRYHIKRSNINHIFISHLHGDHYLGLAGLISTLRLNEKKEDLHIFAPAYLEKILNIQLDIDHREWSFKVVFHPLNTKESKKIFENDKLEVFNIPLEHGIECNGFLFREKLGERKMKSEKIEEYNIPYQQIKEIKKGADLVLPTGETIRNKSLTSDPETPKSYAYCSDTRYNENILPLIKNANLLYHESTFMNDLESKAHERYHSTSIHAGTIAKKAKVKKLIIGHFSARYKDLEPMLKEAQSVFPNTSLALEGESFEI